MQNLNLNASIDDDELTCTTTTTPFAKNSNRVIIDPQLKINRHKTETYQSWFKELLPSVRLIQWSKNNPGNAWFLEALKGAEKNKDGLPIINPPDTFIKVQADEGDQFTAYLTHSLIWTNSPQMRNEIMRQYKAGEHKVDGKQWFVLECVNKNKDYTCSDISKIIRFLYTGDFSYTENEKAKIYQMGDDFGIDEFKKAIQYVQNAVKADQQNPFTNNNHGSSSKKTTVKKDQKKHNSRSVGKNQEKVDLTKVLNNVKAFAQLAEIFK